VPSLSERTARLSHRLKRRVFIGRPLLAVRYDLVGRDLLEALLASTSDPEQLRLMRDGLDRLLLREAIESQLTASGDPIERRKLQQVLAGDNMAVRPELFTGATRELYNQQEAAREKEADERERNYQERRRLSLGGLAHRLTVDGAFKVGVLILWGATLCAWLYRSEQGTDGRYVYNGGSMFDKRTGTLYELQSGHWVVVANTPNR
jgi:hypothetical protein